MNQFLKITKNKKGQSLIEYMILVALVAVAAIGTVQVVSQNIRKQYAKINYALGAQKSGNTTLDEVKESETNQKTLTDFIAGAR